MSEAFGGNRPRDVAFVAPTFIWEVIQRCLYNAAESSLKKIRGRFDWIGNIVFADPCSRCAFEGRECTLLQHLNERPGAHATSLGGPGYHQGLHTRSHVGKEICIRCTIEYRYQGPALQTWEPVAMVKFELVGWCHPNASKIVFKKLAQPAAIKQEEEGEKEEEQEEKDEKMDCSE